MRFSMINKKQGLSLCLAILLAMSVLLCAAVPARAEGGEPLATTDIAESTESVSEEDPAAGKPEADPSETVTNEMGEETELELPETAAFEEAKATLLAAMDQDGNDIQPIEELLPEEPYLRKDFVTAMGKCAGAVSLMRNLDIQLEQLEEKILDSALPNKIQEAYSDTLAREKAALCFDPTTELMEALQAVKAGSPETIYLYKTAAFQIEAEALAQKAHQLWETLDNYEYLVHTFDSDTGSLTARKEHGLEADVLTRLEHLTERRDQLKAKAESFFSLSLEDQASLPDLIRQLEEDTSAFLLSADLLRNGKQVSARVEALDGNIAKVMILAVIGIGAAMVAIVIAIVATVCSARAASKEPKIDLSGTASKNDMRSLTDAFSSEMNLMDQKVQQYQAKRMADIEERLKQLENRDTRKTVPPVPIPPIPAPPVPTPPVEEPRQKIGSLRLKYQDLAPMNSSLIPDETGSLILYKDMTVGLKPELQKLANDMKSWQNQGLLYLFDPQIDGREYTAGQGGFPAGYYVIEQVERTARVRSVGNSYKLESKGHIKMRKV